MEQQTIYICHNNYEMDNGQIAFTKGSLYYFNKMMYTKSDLFDNHCMKNEKEFDFYFHIAEHGKKTDVRDNNVVKSNCIYCTGGKYCNCIGGKEAEDENGCPLDEVAFNPDSPGEVKQADFDYKQFDSDYIMSDGRLKIFESQADEVYKMYMDWTKSGNENLTYFAFAIAKHFNTLGLSTALAKANAEKEEMRDLLQAIYGSFKPMHNYTKMSNMQFDAFNDVVDFLYKTE